MFNLYYIREVAIDFANYLYINNSKRLMECAWMKINFKEKNGILRKWKLACFCTVQNLTKERVIRTFKDTNSKLRC